MMYSAAVGMELMEGLALVQDAVDRSVLEMSERKVEVDGALVWLHHQMGQRDDHIVVIDKWKGDVTEHMRDIGEAQGLVQGRLSEAELHINQFQVVVVSQRQEVDLLGDVLAQLMEVREAQCQLIYRMEVEFNRKLAQLERIFGSEGQSMGNPIMIEDDLVEDVVTLVGHEA